MKPYLWDLIGFTVLIAAAIIAHAAH